ncbi:MAG: hypothetical protein E4H29_03595 [Deltaproteobacteria bacterium]|nr:MAG: hypothetical protein E4H29_03595 [Deltaproteobacteria bacterium]
MSAVEMLKELSSVEGFAGAGVFTPTGETLAMFAPGTGFTKEIGILANNVLMNAQKASLEMGAGRGQQVHVEGEKAHILARCLNEGTDPLKSQPGKTHIHVVMALTSEGSIGLAKMRLNQIAVKTAYYMGLTPTEPVEREVARATRGEIGAGGVRMTRVATGPAEAESALVMPDMRGLSMGRVVDLMGRHSVRLELVGTGLARTQSPRPGGILVPGTACTVTFGAE